MTCQVFYLENYLNKKEIDSLRDIDSNDIKRIQKYTKLFSKEIKRGDLVILEKKRYRNDNVYIYDGVKIMDLAYEPDQYGNIPNCFSVITEFPTTYWKEHIAHNTLVPFNHKKFASEILNRLCLYHQATTNERKHDIELIFKIDDDGTVYRPEKNYRYILRSHVTINKKIYYLYFSLNSYFREYSFEELKELLVLLLGNSECLYYDYDVSSLEEAFPTDLEYEENSIFCDIDLAPRYTVLGSRGKIFRDYDYSEKDKSCIFDNLDNLIKEKLEKYDYNF